jgi:hypothetical protein
MLFRKNLPHEMLFRKNLPHEMLFRKNLPHEMLFRKNREGERKWSARLTHGYMDGGATICAEYKNPTPRGYPFRRPCIHG